MLWKPITKNELEELVNKQFSECSPELREIFEKYRLSFKLAPINRYGNIEGVYIVARNENEVLYYEDVEDGFNFSLINVEGMILEHWCNQDSLSIDLQRWLPKSISKSRLSPASPL